MGLMLTQQLQRASQLAIPAAAPGALYIIFSTQVSQPVIPRLCTQRDWGLGD